MRIARRQRNAIVDMPMRRVSSTGSALNAMNFQVVGQRAEQPFIPRRLDELRDGKDRRFPAEFRQVGNRHADALMVGRINRRKVGADNED